MIRDNGIGLGREFAEPYCGVRRQERPCHGVDERLEDVGHDDGVADRDAQRARQRQPAEHAADLARGPAARGPRVFIRAERARGGAAAHGELCRKADIAENEHEQQIDQQKCPAAVGTQLIRKAPDIRHAHGRADRCQNKAPAAGKALCVFVMFHRFSLQPQKRPCGYSPHRRSACASAHLFSLSF